MLSLDFSPFPMLETDRLLMRQIEDSDAQDLFLLRSDPAIMRYIDRPLAESTQDTLDMIHKMQDSLIANNGISWVITLKPHAKFIGSIGFWRIDKENHRAEIGYMLAAGFHNKGIMSESMITVLKFGFEKLNFHTIEANVNPANEASIRLLEKNHFRREAYFKENYFFNGRFLDSAIYSLINPYQ
ncbi:MAG: GNAT family N-acetyltransferase [Bacteroidetes bacterium]|nr:GNAT family N-acetyltransferase [Bacteroidota bacterium]